MDNEYTLLVSNVIGIDFAYEPHFTLFSKVHRSFNFIPKCEPVIFK